MAPIVAIIFRESADQPFGVSFTKDQPPPTPGPVLISKIAPEGLVAGSDLAVGMKVLSINDFVIKPETTHTEAIEVLKKSPTGQVTITCEKVMTGPVVAVVNRETPDQKFGISFTKDRAPPAPGPVLISKIAPDGLFINTDLQVGMQVKSINNQEIKPEQAHTEAIQMLKDSGVGQVTIIAEAAPPSSTAVNPALAGEVPPPNAPPGGQWGIETYCGDKTTAAACCGCLCFGLPGLCICLCPFDERDVYKAPDNKVYDASGKRLGTAKPQGEIKFTPKRPRAPPAAGGMRR